MLLSEACLRELYAHYNVPFPEAAQSTPPEPLTEKQTQIQQSAQRFKKFETRTKQLLTDEALQESRLHFLYVVLPALFRAASETYATAPKETEEMAGYVDRFLADYQRAYLPNHLLTIVLKILEKRLFKQVSYNAPSLDIGIGEGFASNFILEPNRITVGSEPTFSGLQAARTYGRHDHYLGVDATCIPFQNETFNTVSLIHSIDHVKDRVDVLREVERVMKPGGTLVLSDASHFIEELMPMAGIYKLFGFEELGADTFNHFLDFGGENVTFYSPDIYHRVLGELGFENVEIEYFMAPQVARMAYAQFQIFMVTGGDDVALPKYDKLREFFFDFAKSTIVPLLSADRELCARDGKGLNLFVTARKPGVPETSPRSDVNILDHLVCPQCRTRLMANGAGYHCSSCDLTYPVVDSLPLLIPFYAQGFAKLKEQYPDAREVKPASGRRQSLMHRLHRIYSRL
jgi:ubiquinone/menaquinone biosynthesis C-methylase UbiE/uncharacterized protein YbaR (Trm112 family)